jgi:hypothetical protein
MEFVMSSRYLIAKYVSNLARMEPRNIGVFLEFNGQIYAKFVGEKNQGLDLRTVRSLVSHTGSYKQWIEYWRYMLDQRIQSNELLDRILASSRGNYIVTEGDTVFLPREAANDAAHAIDYLFHLLVDEFPEQKENPEQLSLALKCEEIIKRYELGRLPQFEKEPIVEIQVDGLRQHIRPSYRWINGGEIYFQKVSIDAARPDATQKDVTSTAWMFEKLKGAGGDRSTKALVRLSGGGVLIQQNRIDPAEYLGLLSRVSDAVVNVENDAEVDRAFAPLAH